MEQLSETPFRMGTRTRTESQVGCQTAYAAGHGGDALWLDLKAEWQFWKIRSVQQTLIVLIKSAYRKVTGKCPETAYSIPPLGGKTEYSYGHSDKLHRLDHQLVFALTREVSLACGWGAHLFGRTQMG